MNSIADANPKALPAPASRHRQKSVRAFLILLVLACLLPGIIGAIVLFNWEYERGKVQLGRDTLQTTRALVQAVDSQIMQVQALAAGLATAGSIARGDFAAFHLRARQAVERTRFAGDVVLVDSSGQEIVNTASAFGSPLPRYDHPSVVERVFAAGQPAVSNLHRSRVLNRHVIAVAVPVWRDSTVAFALIVGILPAAFDALLSDQRLPPAWLASVADTADSFVARSKDSATLRGQKLPPAFLQGTRELPEGTLDALTVDGTPVFSAFSRSPVTGWRVSIGIPKAILESQLNRTLLFLAIAVAALFAVGIGVAWLVAGHIAGAFEGLVGPAFALGLGEKVVAPRTDVKEAGKVADALTKAAQLLKQRTAALQQTNRSLLEKERELAEAHRLAKFGTWYWDYQTKEMKSSASVREICGRDLPPFGEMRGTVLTLESWERLDAATRDAAQTDRVHELELRGKHSSGTDLWLYVTAQALRGRDGQIIALRGSLQDITERRRAEEQRLASEKRYRTLFSEMAEGFAVGELIYDARGKPVDMRILEANDAFFVETGLPREILNRPSLEILPVVEQYWIDAYHSVITKGGSVQLEEYAASSQRYYDARAYSPSPGRFAVILRDTTEMKRSERALRESESTLALALKAAGSSVWQMDVAKREVNTAIDLALDMSGLPGGTIPFDKCVSLIHEQERPGVLKGLAELVRGERETLSVELRLWSKREEWRWVLCQGVAAERNREGRATHIVGTHTDITDRKLAQQRVRDAAMHDPLTGLPNRALTLEYGKHVIAAAQRSHGRGALMFVDLDRFKPINDLYGHAAGDRLLKQVAKRLRECIRREDVVGRLGGDEFVIILPHLDAGQHRAAIVAQHVITLVSQPFPIDGMELSVSPSIGIAYFPDHANDIHALLHAADLAMYRVKQSGRASYQIYTHEFDREADEAVSVEASIKDAIQHDGFQLHYQPVVDIRSGRLTGAEALVRLTKANGIGPQRFIPIAEARGLIGDLGDWVANEACRQHAAWHSEGLDIAVSINVSPLQFRQKGFAQKLGKIVADRGTAPGGLEIEVTESAIMESVEEGIEILNQLKHYGMKVALDDFGTGYSSLENLSRLPLDKLKIDQSFVQRVDSAPRSHAVIDAVVALGRAMDLEIVGEGVESEQMLSHMRMAGCDQAQGFLFSVPLPADQFAIWYRQHAVHSGNTDKVRSH